MPLDAQPLVVKYKGRKKKSVVTWKDHTFPALRLMRGMTTAEVARRCNLSPQTVQRIRTLQTTHPRFETIAKIITAFGGQIVVTYPEDN